MVSREIAWRDVVSSESFKDVESFDEAMQLFQDSKEKIVEYKSEFEYPRVDKETLVNRPFMILYWDIEPGDSGQYAVVNCMDTNNTKFSFSDGSSGVMEQLVSIQEKTGRHQGIFVPNGLRESKYGVNREGKAVNKNSPESVRTASTFYLA